MQTPVSLIEELGDIANPHLRGPVRRSGGRTGVAQSPRRQGDVRLPGGARESRGGVRSAAPEVRVDALRGDWRGDVTDLDSATLRSGKGLAAQYCRTAKNLGDAVEANAIEKNPLRSPRAPWYWVFLRSPGSRTAAKWEKQSQLESPVELSISTLPSSTTQFNYDPERQRPCIRSALPPHL